MQRKGFASVLSFVVLFLQTALDKGRRLALLGKTPTPGARRSTSAFTRSMAFV